MLINSMIQNVHCLCSLVAEDCLAISAVAGQGPVELIRRVRALLEELPPPASLLAQPDRTLIRIVHSADAQLLHSCKHADVLLLAAC